MNSPQTDTTKRTKETSMALLQKQHLEIHPLAGTTKEIPFPPPLDPKFTFIDLFAGIGGFHIAMHRFGAKCVFACEWDKYARTTYEENFQAICPDLFAEKRFAGDINDVNIQNIPPFDILCAGFPCQPFSISGQQKGFQDTRGTLFFNITEIASLHQPKVLFLENVKNLLRHSKGETFRIIKKTLEEVGYDVYYKILNASRFGLPQNRERLYIVCFHQSLAIPFFTFPSPTDEPISIAKILEEEPSIEPIERDDVVIKANILHNIKSNISLNKPLQIGYINKGGQGERIYHPQGHGITLSAHGGGVGAKTGLFFTAEGIRRLTPRECARLQGFPEDFTINPNSNQAYKQFGNSVAVPVVSAIAKEIISTLKQLDNENVSRERFGNSQRGIQN